jgi:hypothetical protein
MDPEPLTGRVETLHHLDRYWEERRKEAGRSDLPPSPRPALTIALSREAGTQGTAIGHEVGTRLGWPVYDQELLERIAQDLELDTRLLEMVDETRVSWLQESFYTLMGVPYASESAFVHRLVKSVLALGSHGKCVIVGRGSTFILPAETTLRVRLIAPLEDRIATVRQELGLSQQEARHRVQTMDRQRNGFVRAHFAKDPADPRNYDLLLNAARFGVAGCAQLIVAAGASCKL